MTVSKSKIRGELVTFNDRFNTIAASHDLDGLIRLYAPDALFISPGKTPAPFEASARATFGFITANKGHLSHSVESITISEDGTLATLIGGAVIKVDEMDVDATGTYLFVMKRDAEGSWSIQTDMWHQHSKPE